jgi:hypothetical protein
MHLLSPSISLNVRPGNAGKSEFNKLSNFKTNIGDIIGLTANYRFISAGFALLLNSSGIQRPKDYAVSQYRTATIKYASNSYSLQYRYLRSKGFTDINHASGNNRFTQRPDIVNKEFQFEGLYNAGWRKYSYIAPFSFSHRQVKSRAGLLFKAGVYYSEVSGDSSLISAEQEQYFANFKDIHAIRTFSVKLAPGIGWNFILKKFYFSLAAFPSYDLYFYKFINANGYKANAERALVFNLDCKTNIGIQTKRFYGGLKYEVERRNAFLQTLNSKIVYSYVGLEFGYRFRTPRFVKKVYKETMPPGM